MKRILLLGLSAALLTASSPTTAADPATDSAAPSLRVAIYHDAGPTNCERCLPKGAGFTTRRISAEEIQAGLLKEFDVVIPERTKGLDRLVEQAVRWTAAK